MISFLKLLQLLVCNWPLLLWLDFLSPLQTKLLIELFLSEKLCKN